MRTSKSDDTGDAESGESSGSAGSRGSRGSGGSAGAAGAAGSDVADAEWADDQPLSPSAASLLADVDSNAIMDQLVTRLLRGTPQYTPVQIAEAAGVQRDVSRRLWRAMGLADVPEDVVAFTEMDLDALERTKVLLGQGDIQMHLIVQLARVLGLATARIADSVVDFTLDRLVADSAGEEASNEGADGGAGHGADGDVGDGDAGDVGDGDAGDVGDGAAGDGTSDGISDGARQGVRHGATSDGGVGRSGEAVSEGVTGLPVVSLLLDELDELVVYLLHRHLVDATSRRLSTVSDGATSTRMAVGFADLVGFTALSQEISDAEIVSLIERFETLSSNEVVGAGGRIIKMIGDEVMFSAAESAGPEIALRLTETFTDPELPSIRVGLASGAVLSRSGDLFGPVVNLAARATAIAHPGTVVVSASVRDQVADDERYSLRRLRPRRLKGIGFVELNVLRRAKGHEAESHPEDNQAEQGSEDHETGRGSEDHPAGRDSKDRPAGRDSKDQPSGRDSKDRPSGRKHHQEE